jgi:hypothetical protein
MLWNRYQYSIRKEQERRELAKDTNPLPTFLEWIYSGGSETKRALTEIQKEIDIDIDVFLQTLEG